MSYMPQRAHCLWCGRKIACLADNYVPPLKAMSPKFKLIYDTVLAENAQHEEHFHTGICNQCRLTNKPPVHKTAVAA